MNEPRESEVSIRMPFMITIVLSLMILSSFVSYRMGKGQAYQELMQECLNHKVSAALCFLSSKEAVNEVFKVVDLVLREDDCGCLEEDPIPTREEVEMFLKSKKV